MTKCYVLLSRLLRARDKIPCVIRFMLCFQLKKDEGTPQIVAVVRIPDRNHDSFTLFSCFILDVMDRRQVSHHLLQDLSYSRSLLRIVSALSQPRVGCERTMRNPGVRPYYDQVDSGLSLFDGLIKTIIKK